MSTLANSTQSLSKECCMCRNPFEDGMRFPRIIHETNGNSKHVACTQCLEEIWKEDSKTVVCPHCSNEVRIISPSQLEIESACIVFNPIASENCEYCDDDQATSRCNTCRIYLCASCSITHRKRKVTRSHEVKDLSELTDKDKSSFSRRTLCSRPNHGQIIELYCHTCKTPCCDRCAIEDHKNHEYEQLQNVLEKKSGKIKESDLEVQKQKVDTLRRQYQKMLEKVKDHQTQSEVAIEKYFTQAVNILEDRRGLLTTKLSQKNQKLQNRYGLKIEDLESRSKTLGLGQVAAAGGCIATTDVALLAFHEDLQKAMTSIREYDENTLNNDNDADYGYDFIPGNSTDMIQQFLLAIIQGNGIDEDADESGGQPETRLLVIGKKATGRGKTIYSFLDQLKPATDSQRSAKVWSVKFSGKPFKIAITAGLDNPSVKGGLKREKDDISHLLYPGPHIVLLVVKNPDSDDQVNILSDYKSIFNEDITKHLILVYTGKKELDEKGVTMSEFFPKRAKGSLRSLLQQIGKRYIGFNPFAKGDFQSFRYRLCSLIMETTDVNENRNLTLRDETESTTSERN